MVNEKKIKEEVYRLAQAQYTAREPQALKVVGARYPRREELHQR